VFKAELDKHTGLGQVLAELSVGVKVHETACIYFPHPGKLLQLVGKLNDRKVSYGIQSEKELRYDENGQLTVEE
jgi:hypothetical protein